MRQSSLRYLRNLSVDVMMGFVASVVILVFTTIHIDSSENDTRMIGTLFGAISLQAIVNSLGMFLNYPKIYLSTSLKDKLKQIRTILKSIQILVLLYLAITIILFLVWLITDKDLILITCALIISTITTLLLENRTIVLRWTQNLGVYSALQSFFSIVMFGFLSIAVNFQSLNLTLIIGSIFLAAMVRILLIFLYFTKKIRTAGSFDFTSAATNYIGLFQLSGLINLFKKHGFVSLFSLVDARFLGEIIITFRAFDLVGSVIERMLNMLMVNLKTLSINILSGALSFIVLVFFVIYLFINLLYPEITNSYDPIFLLGLLRILSMTSSALAAVLVHRRRAYLQNIFAVVTEAIFLLFLFSFFNMNLLSLYLCTSIISSGCLLLVRKL